MALKIEEDLNRGVIVDEDCKKKPAKKKTLKQKKAEKEGNK